MLKKLVSFMILISILLLYTGCDPNGDDELSQEFKEYAFAVLFVCSLGAGLGVDGTSYETVGNTTTYTFNDFVYDEDSGAVANGSFAETDDEVTFSDVGSLEFTDDTEGLETMDLDFSGTSGEDTIITDGVITINGTDVPATELQEWMDSLVE